jgi:hypothetical protein
MMLCNAIGPIARRHFLSVFYMHAYRWIILTLALLCGASGIAHSEVYRWKDSAGRIHFGDQPMSTDPQVVQKVEVPSTNLAKPFEPSAKPPAINPVERSDEGQATIPLSPMPIVAGPKKLTGVAASQATCQAKVQAYKASTACFDACGRPNGRGGRNTAGCEYCGDQPMPSC